MNVFSTTSELIASFRYHGAGAIFFKPLEENDNRKQQIYLGDSPESVAFLSTRWQTDEVEHGAAKSSLSFQWVDPTGIAAAPHAKLIYYRDYPEVRLSGFILGAKLAPSSHLQPVPKSERQGFDGRVLFLGVRGDGDLLAHLATAGSPLALDARSRAHPGVLITQLA